MSNITSNSAVAQEQLFTELTPEEGSVIEGGAFLAVHGIYAVKAGADTFGNDDTLIKVATGGTTKQIGGEYSMSSGKYASVGQGIEFNDLARLDLYDEDGIWSRDDHMGGFWISPTSTNGPKWSPLLSGSGSQYYVNYSVYA